MCPYDQVFLKKYGRIAFFRSFSSGLLFSTSLKTDWGIIRKHILNPTQ